MESFAPVDEGEPSCDGQHNNRAQIEGESTFDCKTNKHEKKSTVETTMETGTSANAPNRMNTGEFKFMTGMALNDNKAGMEGLDKEKINQIIFEISKGSKFFENEQKKEGQLKQRIREQQNIVDQLSSNQLKQGLKQADQLLRELEEGRELDHTIVHVDMDAFYAAVEMRDDPSLRNQPMAVGGQHMLSTSNYLARKFGVRAAMPGFIAIKLCPQLLIVKPNYDKYTEVSHQAREIFTVYDPNFCPMSLDEAYLDFTQHLEQRQVSPPSSRTFVLRADTDTSKDSKQAVCKCDPNKVIRPYLTGLAEWQSHDVTDEDMKKFVSSLDLCTVAAQACAGLEIDKGVCPHCRKRFPPFTVQVYDQDVESAVLEMRNRIEQRTQLTASAGIAPNTMLAKVCSDMNKPNGQFRIHPDLEEVEQFISTLPIRKVSGIGKVMEKLLGALNVTTCADLYKQRALLYHVFQPISFRHFMSVALGLGSTTVERHGERKSMSTERTFSEISRPAQLIAKCGELCRSLAEDLQEHRLQGKTVTLKIKTVTFEVKGRSHTLSQETNDEKQIFAAATQLLNAEIEAARPGPLRLRLMGIRMSKLSQVTRGQTSITSLFQKYANSASVIDHNGESGDGNGQSSHMVSEVNDISASRAGDQSEDVFWIDADEDEDFHLPVNTPKTNNSISNGRSNTKPVITGAVNVPQKLSPLKKEQKSGRDGSILKYVQKRSAIRPLAEGPSPSKVGRNQQNKQQTSDSGTTGTIIIIDNEDVEDATPTCKSSALCPAMSKEKTDIDNSFFTQSQHAQHRSEDTTPSSVGTDCLATRAPDLPGSSGSITCPVCGQCRQNWALDRFNAHIDECLNVGTIRDLQNGEQNQPMVLPPPTDRKLKRSQANFDRQQRNLGNKCSKTQMSVAAYFKC